MSDELGLSPQCGDNWAGRTCLLSVINLEYVFDLRKFSIPHCET